MKHRTPGRGGGGGGGGVGWGGGWESPLAMGLISI